ncbi:MAG: hypothetical protein CMJ13_07860 [Pelagibacterales bacterium]|nr:hypothetical protein [Pelagibacterales bacterium]
MNYSIYRSMNSTFYVILISAILSILFAIKAFAKTTDNPDYYKNKFNEELLKGVLKGAGFSNKDALLATQSFKKVYPPERLTDSSYLILPFVDTRMNTFAISIDGIEAVLITKIKNKFKTFITSSNYAHKFVEKGIGEINENSSLIEIETHLQDAIKTDSKFSEEKITFAKGDTLLNFLYVPGSKRKEISSAIKAFSLYFDPEKIKIKTKGKIIRTNKGKILGFYLVLSQRKSILTYLSPTGYETVLASKKRVEEALYNNIKSYFAKFKLLNSTRISLLNDPQLEKIKIKIKKGSNLFNSLKKENIYPVEIGNLLNSLKNIYNPKVIRPEQEILVAFKDNKFFGISIEVNELREVQVIKTEQGFKEYIFKKPVKKIFLFKNIKIKSNLYVDSLSIDLPQEILIDMVRLLSYSIDFQRDIRKSNSFYVYYEFLQNYNGQNIIPGNIIYAEAKLEKKSIEMFRYEAENNDIKYFNSKGESIRKTLMKTPIDGARLSSRFGKRMHPVLGYSKMHKGVDFAAKRGTPIYAAGDGIIERANVYGGYGKYIRIRHNSEYKTAYAHLHKFAKKIKKGINVKQGQIIGYVGSTGRSTGPHLHYEILRNKKQINPQTLKLPEGKKLDESEMQEFIKVKQNILKKIENYLN